jgi:hypothetical protein
MRMRMRENWWLNAARKKNKGNRHTIATRQLLSKSSCFFIWLKVHVGSAFLCGSGATVKGTALSQNNLIRHDVTK